MATYLFKGTSNYASDGVTDASNSYDGATTYGDTSTYSYVSSTSSARAMAVYGCNNSEVLNLVNSGRKIKTLIFHVNARKHDSSTTSTDKISARCVYDISGINTYTDAGDGSLALADSMTTTTKEYTVSFPSAVNYFNSNPSKFSEICGRFYGYYWRIYDMWWEIELEEVKVSCTITYNGNGETSGSVAAQSGYIGDSLTLKDNGFVKKCNVTYYSNEDPNIVDDSLDELQTSVSSATFLGWYTAAEGGTRVGGSGDSYTPSGDTTLYAHWSAAVTTPTLTRDGYTLLGWYTERSGGTKVADGGGSYTPTGSIALYAHWKINSTPSSAATNMIYIGTKQPTFYIGTKQVQSIYLGMSLIYEVVLPTISYDNITTFENLLVPSGETSNTYTLPPANLENAEGNISYALYSDNECTTSVGTGITFDENTRQVTISNAAKDTVATQDTDKDGLAKFYIKATYESLSVIGEITLENYKVTATFSYRNNKNEDVDKTTEVYYGTSAEKFAGTINDFSSPKNDEHCHYIKNGWVDFYGETEIDRVIKDTTFVLPYTQEPHEIDPTIAGYDKKEPTCTEAGYTKGYCGYCAKQENGYKGLIQVEIPATGHKDTNGDDICDVCGESIVTIVDSGTCGSNLTYTLDSNGVLTISGTGDMQNSSFGWDKDLIKSVVINDGVTRIGSNAFSACTGLTSVTIPDSVTSIGNYAFRGCTGLTSITIPDSVTSISGSAFYNTALYNNDSNWEDNVLYIGNHLIEAKDSISGVYNIKDGTKTIAVNAFSNCDGLTSVTIPDSVTIIGHSAFYNCTGLTSVTIPDSVTSIGGYAFYNTALYNNDSNWEDNVLYIGNHLIEAKDSISGVYNIKDGTKTIAVNAFSSCRSLTSITIPDSVTIIGDSAFYYCDGLTSVTIPNSVTSIGESAFERCTGLTSITIPDGVMSIGSEAFASCKSLTTITVSTGNIVYHSTDNCLIETETKTLISGCKSSIIPADGSVTSIGERAFSGCTGLKSITIPDSVTSIDEYAFFGCTGLTSITIPDGVTSIGKSPFRNCTSLTKITVSSSNTVYHSVGNCLIKTETKTLVLGCQSSIIPTDGSVTSIGNYAFSGCTGLTSITIPDSVTSIGYEAFFYCAGLKRITIPDSVTSIGGSAFEDCSGLTSITIGNSVTIIGDSTFYGCDGLTSITIPNSVTSIGDSAFKNCYGLTSVTIPDSVISIGAYAFSNCNKLTVDFSACTDIPTLESSDVFSNTSSSLVIKVPSTLLDEWKAATNWATYADKIVGV